MPLYVCILVCVCVLMCALEVIIVCVCVLVCEGFAVSPHGRGDDLHDTLIDALAHVDQGCPTHPHLPQQQTCTDGMRNHKSVCVCVSIVDCFCL